MVLVNFTTCTAISSNSNTVAMVTRYQLTDSFWQLSCYVQHEHFLDKPWLLLLVQPFPAVLILLDSVTEM